MKKFIQQTIVTTVVVIILPLQNRAQVCPDTITQVSTNFYNPINTQFDAKTIDSNYMPTYNNLLPQGHSA